ncbi:hypothetical protein [Desulfobotulus mexicanus]|uniref:Uncharacterized protein n=1 Tax=Desulfobotulus mexicanus TaxID=2586642 RepID=A0A5S5MC57_9BACT|nr:hypothetical protein [Desulfobotulus mexicanus]TYT73261.1 hypothetical protein FIM25_16105 [Desulfobotulus mexicanus]
MAIFLMNQKKRLPLRYPHGAKNAVLPPPPRPLQLWDVVDGWIVYWLDEASNKARLVIPSSRRFRNNSYATIEELVPGIEPTVPLDGADPYTGKHNTEFLKVKRPDGGNLSNPGNRIGNLMAAENAMWPNIQELTQLLHSDLHRIDAADTSGGGHTFASIAAAHGYTVISSSQHGTHHCVAYRTNNFYVPIAYSKEFTAYVIAIRELPISGAG